MARTLTTLRMARHHRHDFPKPLPQNASNQGTSCTIAAKLASSAVQADTTELAVFRANLPMTVLAIGFGLGFGHRLIIAHEPSDQCPKQSLNKTKQRCRAENLDIASGQKPPPA